MKYRSPFVCDVINHEILYVIEIVRHQSQNVSLYPSTPEPLSVTYQN
jgi:hypothetical protein